MLLQKLFEYIIDYIIKKYDISKRLSCNKKKIKNDKKKHLKKHKKKVSKSKSKSDNLPRKTNHIRPICTKKTKSNKLPSAMDGNKQIILQKIQEVIQNSIQLQNSEKIKTNLNEYFDEVNGVLVPKNMQFCINGQTIDIPKFIMVNHSNIELKELRFKFETNAMEMGISDTDTTPFQTEVVFDTFPNPISGYSKLTEICYDNICMDK
jgi:hypothetical protein